MADAVTIIASIVGGALGGGGIGGIVSMVVALRRERREQTLTVWESYDRQIKSAEARGDQPEVLRLRLEQEGQLEAWRAQQGVENLAPREISAAREGPSLTEQEVEQLRTLLAQSQSLSPALLSAGEYFLRANAYYGAGQYDEALDAFDHVLKLRPDDPATLNNRGITLGHLGRHEEALADYNRSLDLRPDDPATLTNRGVTLRHLERYEEALADHNRSLELRPDDPDTLTNRGNSLYHLRRYEEALAEHNRSLELRPDHPETLSNRGATLHQLGRYEEALADYNRALELRPDGPMMLNNRAVLLTRHGHHEDALRDIDRALLAKPVSPSYRGTRAEILHRQGNATAAETELERVLAEAADKADAHYVVAETWSVLGALVEAYSNLSEALAAKEGLRARARHDPDFDNLRHDREYGPRLRALVGEDEAPPEGGAST